MTFILLLIILVAAFNIVSTLTMVVARQDARRSESCRRWGCRPRRSAASSWFRAS